MHFPKYDLTLVHVPKTAGTSILRTLGGGGATHEKLSEVTRGKTVGVVRNPFDRLVSVWAYFRQGGNQTQDGDVQAATPEFFSDFVRCYIRDGEPYPRQYFLDTQKSYLTDGDREIDYLLRFETVARDWRKLALRLNLPPKLAHVRKSEHKPFRDLYSPELVDIVAEYYADDLRKYEYSF